MLRRTSHNTLASSKQLWLLKLESQLGQNALESEYHTVTSSPSTSYNTWCHNSPGRMNTGLQKQIKIQAFAIKKNKEINPLIGIRERNVSRHLFRKYVQVTRSLHQLEQKKFFLSQKIRELPMQEMHNFPLNWKKTMPGQKDFLISSDILR